MPFEVVTELYPGGKPAIHIHPDQVETYQVKEGEMQLFVNGKWKTPGAEFMESKW